MNKPIKKEDIIISEIEILEKLGKSLITENIYDTIKIKKDDVEYILKSEALSIEHKKEIFEKMKLLKLFASEYISYTTPPTRQNCLSSIYSAIEILQVKDEVDFSAKIKILDNVLEFCKKVTLNPFESTKEKIKQQIYEIEIYKKGGKF